MLRPGKGNGWTTNSSGSSARSRAPRPAPPEQPAAGPGAYRASARPAAVDRTAARHRLRAGVGEGEVAAGAVVGLHAAGRGGQCVGSAAAGERDLVVAVLGDARGGTATEPGAVRLRAVERTRVRIAVGE